MKLLTLVRHGQAEWKASKLADFDRPLTRRGLAEVTDMARRLRVRELPSPDLILTSAALRTVQTSEVFAKELGVSPRLVKLLDTLYLAAPEVLLEEIAGMGPRVAHLLVVGHNPGLSDLAVQLAPDAGLASFATGACCTLTFDSRSWQEPGRASSAEYDAPGRFFDLWH
ncbi:MAG TPA: histidine phosphatase family protein [Steroidobacteraceae bacterium]|nr:histidine phosphatase family protein [Steroidobacteraceae bacterium]